MSIGRYRCNIGYRTRSRYVIDIIILLKTSTNQSIAGGQPKDDFPCLASVGEQSGIRNVIALCEEDTKGYMSVLGCSLLGWPRYLMSSQ